MSAPDSIIISSISQASFHISLLTRSHPSFSPSHRRFIGSSTHDARCSWTPNYRRVGTASSWCRCATDRSSGTTLFESSHPILYWNQLSSTDITKNIEFPLLYFKPRTISASPHVHPVCHHLFRTGCWRIKVPLTFCSWRLFHVLLVITPLLMGRDDLAKTWSSAGFFIIRWKMWSRINATHRKRRSRAFFNVCTKNEIRTSPIRIITSKLTITVIHHLSWRPLQRSDLF